MSETNSFSLPRSVRWSLLLMLCLFCFALGRVVEEFSKSSSVKQAVQDAQHFEKETTRLLDALFKDLNKFAESLQGRQTSPTTEMIMNELDVFRQKYQNRNPYRVSYHHVTRMDRLKEYTSNIQPVNFDFSGKFDKLSDKEARLKFENLFHHFWSEFNLLQATSQRHKRSIQLETRSSSTSHIDEKGNPITFYMFDKSWLIKSKSDLLPQATYLSFQSTYNLKTKRYDLRITIREFSL